MQRLTGLDGLRGVLASYVMVSHMAPFALLPGWLQHALSHGGAGVDVFFILSGLVIVRSLQAHRFQPAPFLRARVRRIFPVFLVMFTTAILVQPLPAGFDRMSWISPEARDIWSQGWPRTWALDIPLHLVMAHGLFPHAVLPDVWVSFLGAAWSLSTEWQFYVLALLVGRRCGDPCRLAWQFIGLAALGLAWDVTAPEAWRFSRAFLPNKAQYFAVGIASAALVDGRPGARGSFAGVLLAAMALSLPHGGAEKALPLLAWTLCLSAEFGRMRWLGAMLRSAPLQWLGALSYSLYLANEPVQKLLGVTLTRLTDGDALLFTTLWVPLSILLPLGLAAWLRRWVERPWLVKPRAA